MMPITSAPSFIGLSIDLFAIVVGVISALMIFFQGRQIGGRVGSAVGLFVWGALFQAFAFTYSIVAGNTDIFQIFSALPFDVHHLLMAIGMVLFFFSARKFVSIGG